MSSKMNIGIVVHEILEKVLKRYHENGYNDLVGIDLALLIGETVIAYDLVNKPKLVTFGDENFSYDNSLELDQWERDIDLAVAIAQRTIKFLDVPNNWRTEIIEWDGVTVPLIEFKFEYPLVADRTIVGKIDWVARSLKDGQVYLIDWKTRGKFTDDFEISGEDMNLQASIYQYVLNSLGVETFGTITYQIRSSIPEVPKINKGTEKKKGHVSKANITTDYATYMQALLDNEEDIEEYSEMLADLKAKGNEWWFLPIIIIRGKRELSERWKTVQKIAKRMIEDSDPAKYESPQCQYCPFFKICLGEDRGFDVDFIKKDAYNTEERPH